jgi:protocatechuate 3,4-dioxygenase beta subunit
MYRRDDDSFAKWSEVSHDISSSGFDLDTPLSDVFASNATCALVPEVTIGPYYVAGEMFRSDVTDRQSGVPVHLDMQFVDISTCEGVSDLLIDIWHCNSTGVYSGVSNQGQGGLDSTHGRGVQASDSDGVVQFDTLFPGHYTGRATHIHLMSTADAKQFDNGTFTGGTAKHIGQLFFDADLIDKVEKLEPYSTNTQVLTTNDQDNIAPAEATDEFDPFLNYVMLGDNLSDGLLMWTMIAIDTTADYNDAVSAAANYYEDGGVDNPNAGGPPGGPGGPGASGTSSDSTGSTASPVPSAAGAARARILFF